MIDKMFIYGKISLKQVYIIWSTKENITSALI